MVVQYNLDLFRDKEDLLADLRTCLGHITTLRDFKTSPGSSVVTITELTSQREALQEKVYKIFIKWKEEWRLVLLFVPEFMSIALAALEAEKLDDVDHIVVFDMIMDFLRNMTLCISAKRVARYWPTEVQWLTRVVGWLERNMKSSGIDGSEGASGGSGDSTSGASTLGTSTSGTSDSTDSWSSLYLLILWLSSAVRTPFDLSRFDVQFQGPELTRTETLEHRIDVIIKTTVKTYSLLPVVHLLAGTFYSRPDIVRTSSRLERFICLLLQELKNSTEDSSINDKVCYLRSLATLLKNVDRAVLQPHVDQIVDTVLPMVESEHELLTKLIIKILGRSALTRIRPRLLKWRYNCGKRVIDRPTDSNPKHPNLKEIKHDGQSFDDPEDPEASDGEDEYLSDDLPPYFEDLIQTVLGNINHGSSVVRFSVAKYLASICSRLPYRFSEDILMHITEELCSPTQDDLAWHGACLALAEFVRRGYVRIDFMPKVVDVVEGALFYEHIKGSFSLGTYVRDSAAYICWSMARAYDARLIGQFVDRLAPLLVSTACFDRQLNCRRAASAVIQELSGRTQRFPHWIEVIGRTEFHELSLVEHTFLDLGVHFATEYQVFQPTIIRHLCTDKSGHWDPVIRRLAAEAIGKISEKIPFAGTEYLDTLLEKSLGPDLNGRHGAILALAHLIGRDLSLRELSPDLKLKIVSLVQRLSTRNLFAGIGGDFMREACLLLIDQYCRTQKLSGNSDFLGSWRQLLLNTIQTCETDFVQTQAIPAIVSFVSFLEDSQPVAISHEDSHPEATPQKVSHPEVAPQEDSNPEVEQNSRKHFLTELLTILHRHEQYYPISTVCKSLLLMEPAVLRESLPQFISALCGFIEKVFGNILRRSETVADAIKALVCVADYAASGKFLDRKLKFDQKEEEEIFPLLTRCLDDHTITNKGDVGLFVRIAAIEAIFPKVIIVPEDGNSRQLSQTGNFIANLDSGKILRILQLVISEAIYHRNKSFNLALGKLAELSTKCRDKLLEVLPEVCLGDLKKFGDLQEEDENQYKLLIRLLTYDPLTYDLWPGLVCVLADRLEEPFTKLVINFLRELDSVERDKILVSFLKFFSDRGKVDSRLSIPCLIAANQLLLQVPTRRQFQREVAELSWNVCQGSLNPKKYLHACDVFCTLVPLVPSVDDGGDDDTTSGNGTTSNLLNSLRFLYVLLGHKLPRVRSYTATELYTALLSIDDAGDDEPEVDDEDAEEGGGGGLMEAISLLQETDWLVIGEAKVARDKIRTILKKIG